MCAQLDILKKIRDAGEMNGYAVELAEAQVKDYVHTNKRMSKMEKDIAAIKKAMATFATEQARQGGMMEAIFKRLNGPVEAEREAGQKWNLLVSITKHKAAWVILALVLASFALAGDRLATIIEKVL